MSVLQDDETMRSIDGFVGDNDAHAVYITSGSVDSLTASSAVWHFTNISALTFSSIASTCRQIEKEVYRRLQGQGRYQDNSGNVVIKYNIC